MRKIAVFDQKGGVGKTTTSVNLAAGLSRNNKSVLLIDLDPQGDISVCHNTDAKYDIFHFLADGADFSECVTKLGKNLDLLHSDQKLADAEQQASKSKNPLNFLKDKFEGKFEYDYIILDCPPSLRVLNKAALVYADEVVIPASTDVLGFNSLKKTVKRINEFNEKNNNETLISSILPTMFDKRNKICKEILKLMQKDYSSLLVQAPIRMNTKLKEAPKAKKSIFTYDKRSTGAEDYWKFVKSVLENEHMYDDKLSVDERDKAIRDYYVHGKKRELMYVGNKITFGYKFITEIADSGKGVYIEGTMRKKKASA